MMHYKLFKTAKKTAEENGLDLAVSKYNSTKNLFYDFSIIDDIPGLTHEEKEIIKAETMLHHSVSWYEQPLPLLALGKWTCYTGQIETLPHRIYNSEGKRSMVIIEVRKAHIEKQTRKDVWSEYKTEAVFDCRTDKPYFEDYEMKEGAIKSPAFSF